MPRAQVICWMFRRAGRSGCWASAVGGTVWGCVVWAIVFAVAAARADDWPQWRGPRLDSVSHEQGLPTEWTPESVLWRVPLPGPAGSSPVVVGDRVFVTSVDEQALLLLCFGTDGSEHWRREFGRGSETVREDEGNAASPSPISDGRLVWANDANGHLACFDVQGEPVWSLDLQETFGRFVIQFGMTSTPVLHDGKLYLQLIHGSMHDDAPSRGTIAALDAATGREIWRRERATDATVECKHAYTSPTLYFGDGEPLLLVLAADYISAHTLTEGDEVWRCGGLNPKGNYNPLLRFVASPVCDRDLVVVPSAKNGPVLGVNPRLTGDITNVAEGVRWRMDQNTPDVPTPLIFDGLVYLLRENGVLICLDGATGERLYEERTASGRHRASPVVAGGHLYLTARSGLVSVVRAGRTFELVAQNDMEEEISASPAVADGRIYLRTFNALYAIGPR